MVGLRVGLLRIGSDSEDNNAITETSVQLPWRKLLNNVNTITEVRTAADGSYPVSVKDLSGWFGTYLAADNSTRAHTGLDTFKGEGFILNKPGNECISLEGMFDGATSLSKATGMEHWKTNSVRSYARMFYANQMLYDLDIQDWDMTNAHIQDTPTTQDMFNGMGSYHMGLASLTLGPNAVLEGTNLAKLLPHQQEGRPFHNEGDGVWVMGRRPQLRCHHRRHRHAVVGHHRRLHRALQARQDRPARRGRHRHEDRRLATVAPPADLIHKYTWVPRMLGGNFPSNANVWWKIDDKTRELTIGLHNKDLCNVVTEFNHFVDGDVVAGYEQFMTPWARLGAAISSFKVDQKNGKVAPMTLEGWFDEDYVFRGGGLAGQLGNHAWNANNQLEEWQRYISDEWINLDWESTANGYRPSDGYNQVNSFYHNWTNWTYSFDPQWYVEKTDSNGNRYTSYICEKIFTPIYLEAGETYYMALDYTTAVQYGDYWTPAWYWGYPDYGFELYTTLDRRQDTHRYNGVHVYLPRNTDTLTHGYVTFTVDTTGTYYVGFDAQGFSDNYGRLTGWTAKDLSVARYAKFTYFDGSGLDTTNTTSFERMFNNAVFLRDIIGVDDWDTTRVTTMQSMLRNTKALTTLDSIKEWNVSNVVNFSRMFEGMQSMDATLNLDWVTISAEDLSYMFYNNTFVPNTNYLKLWDVSKVTNYTGMFKDATALEDAAAISDWRLGIDVTSDLTEMFMGTPKLAAIDMRGWNLGSPTILDRMLCNATALRSMAFGVTTSLKGAYLGLNEEGRQFPSRNARAGGWIRLNATKDWFGSTADVAALYPTLDWGNTVEGPVHLHLDRRADRWQLLPQQRVRLVEVHEGLQDPHHRHRRGEGQ